MRILGLDVTRSLAIFLAMFSHVYAEVNLRSYLTSEISIPLQFMLQVSTPIFVLLFGTMLEIVYYPRWISEGKRAVASKLFLRAAQCYVLYAISILTLYLTNSEFSFAFSVSCLLFMGNSPYTEILKFYSVALAIAPALLWARSRFGLAPLVALAFLYQAIWPILSAVPDAHRDLGLHLQFARLIKFVTGFGSPKIAGPSVLHGLTLVAAGQMLGALISKRSTSGAKITKHKGPEGFFERRVSSALCIMIFISVLAGFFLPSEAYLGLADMSLRMKSHVLYFGIGIISAFTVSIAFVWLVDVRTQGSKAAWVTLSFFGRTSLFTFAWGNILLYAIRYQPSSATSVYIFAGLLTAAICLMSLVFDMVLRHSISAQSLLRVLNVPLVKLTKMPFALLDRRRSTSAE